MTGGSRNECYRCERTWLEKLNMCLGKSGYMLRSLLFLLALLATVAKSQAQNCVSQITAGDVCPSNQFMNLSRPCCMQCTDCNLRGLNQQSPCNATHDAVCVPFCPSLKHWSERDRKCVISDCSKCPGGRCLEGLEACYCGNDCYTGDTCLQIRDECKSESPSVKITSPETMSTSLNPLSIGLIAIGVVIGIVAFSSCFLLFGLCTTKQRRIAENQGSENSESGLVTGRGFTNSTRSSYMSGMNSSTTAFLNNQSMLELLRHSNTPVHSSSGSSSMRSSPKNFRSSPKLVRTSPLVPEKCHGNGLITSV